MGVSMEVGLRCIVAMGEGTGREWGNCVMVAGRERELRYVDGIGKSVGLEGTSTQCLVFGFTVIFFREGVAYCYDLENKVLGSERLSVAPVESRLSDTKLGYSDSARLTA